VSSFSDHWSVQRFEAGNGSGVVAEANG